MCGADFELVEKRRIAQDPVELRDSYARAEVQLDGIGANDVTLERDGYAITRCDRRGFKEQRQQRVATKFDRAFIDVDAVDRMCEHTFHRRRATRDELTRRRDEKVSAATRRIDDATGHVREFVRRLTQHILHQ